MSRDTSKPRSLPASSEHSAQGKERTDERSVHTLKLVPVAAERGPLLAEPAATELRQLIRSLQERHAARRSQPGGTSRQDDEPLPAA